MPALLSPDPSRRNRTLEEMGLSWMRDREITDARLFATRLDSDAPAERIVFVRNNADEGVVVLGYDKGRWWRLTTFVCCGPRGQHPDTFVELKQTVSYGTSDIVVHSGGAQGTGVGEVRLQVYRTWNKQLYKVLDIAESRYNLAESEEAEVRWPSVDSGTGIRRLWVTIAKLRAGKKVLTCAPYRWDTERFLFVEEATRAGACDR